MTDTAILEDIRRDEEIASLRAEVAHWKGLALDTNIDTRARLTMRIGLTVAEGWTLAMLYALAGRPLTHERMIAGMPGHGGERDSNTCAVIVSRLRGKIPDPAFVVTLRGIGYALTPTGINWVAGFLSTDS